MSEIVFLVEDAPEGGYTARALGFSIYTDADSWEELKVAVQDAVACHFDEGQKPQMVRLHFIREEVITIIGRTLSPLMLESMEIIE
jgi:hypothetical protein